MLQEKKTYLLKYGMQNKLDYSASNILLIIANLPEHRKVIIEH